MFYLRIVLGFIFYNLNLKPSQLSSKDSSSDPFFKKIHNEIFISTNSIHTNSFYLHKSQIKLVKLKSIWQNDTRTKS